MIFCLGFPVWLVITLVVSAVAHRRIRRPWWASVVAALVSAVLYFASFMAMDAGSPSDVSLLAAPPILVGMGVLSFLVSLLVGLQTGSFDPPAPTPDVCWKCGYDLRPHAKGERCPECGTAVG